MSEWLGTGLQNRSQRFESAWNLEKPLRAIVRALCLLRLLPATAEIFTNLAGKVKTHIINLGISFAGLKKRM